MVKVIGRMLGWLRALPLRVDYALGRALYGRERALTLTSEKIARVGGNLGIYARQAFYRSVLAGVGEDVHFGFMSCFSKTGATLGDRVYVGRFCTVGWAVIGDDVMLADGVQVLSGRHQHGDSAADGDAPARDQPQQFEKVTIGRGAWLGAGAIVMADVGEGAIVAAGAVVVSPVPPRMCVGGVPARGIGGSDEATKRRSDGAGEERHEGTEARRHGAEEEGSDEAM